MPKISNQQTMADLLTAVTNRNLGPGTNGVLDQFANDSGSGLNVTPCVGISEHGLNIGPAFRGMAQIKVLFMELFRCFNPLTLTQVYGTNPLTAANEIGIQANLIGVYINRWFEYDTNYFSPPLSRITTTGNDLSDYDKQGNLLPGIPTFALFTFNGAFEIVNLALYLDRYKFVQRLGPEDTSIPVPGSKAQNPGPNQAIGATPRRVTITFD